MTYTQQHLEEASRIIAELDTSAIESMAELLARFVKTVGGCSFLE